MAAPEIRKIGVVGLGSMGAGIAQLAIEAGYETIGREVTRELGQQARERISHFLQRKVDKDRTSATARKAALDRLSITRSQSARSARSVVIEAIVEDLEAKLAL